MNTRRLLILADFLESIPEKFTFDLSSWGHDAGPLGVGDSNYQRMQEILTPEHNVTKNEAEFLFVDCGFTACAVGHACLSHKLRSEGLTYLLDPDRPHDISAISMEPYFEGYYGWEAVRKFFEISDDTADYFFSDGEYVSPIEGNITAKDVAARIRETVAEEATLV